MRFALFLPVLLLSAVFSYNNQAHAASSDNNWVQPAPTLRIAGGVSTTEFGRRPDCIPLTYRYRFDLRKTMQTGCFTRTALGLFDGAQSVIIPHDSDEAQRIEHDGQSTTLKPIPNSNVAARIQGRDIFRTYMYLYSAQDAKLPDNGTVKDLSPVPSITLNDPKGRPLPVNPGAMAFSAQGQWMVTEVPGQSLVRVNMKDHSIKTFDHSFYSSGHPLVSHTASMSTTEDGRYVAVYNHEKPTLKLYDLASNCPRQDTGSPIAPELCASHDYWPYLKQQIPDITRMARVSFIHDNLLSFVAQTPEGSSRYLLAPSGRITSLLPYLALGDSFASGQGAWNYLVGTDTNSNHCHLSIHSYPLLLSDRLFGNNGRSVACSGARIHDIKNTSPRYSGQNSEGRNIQDRKQDGSFIQILEDYKPGYIAQEAFAAQNQPDHLTIQIGGNDIGFGNLILKCVSPIASFTPPAVNPSDCYSTYEDRLEVTKTIDRNYPRWVDLYRHLRQQTPNTEIYAIGYPQIVAKNGKCDLSTPLSAGDIDFARNITTYLNSVIEQAALTAGVHYIDIADALSGFELCSNHNGNAAVNGITFGNDSWKILGQESFHPNAFGHKLIEQTILRRSNNLTLGKNAAGTDTNTPMGVEDSNPLLQVPRSGRVLQRKIPVASLATLDHESRVATIHFESQDTIHLKNRAPFTVKLGELPAYVVSSSSAGEVTAAIPIPAWIAPGILPVSVIGPSTNESSIVLEDVIYLPSHEPIDALHDKPAASPKNNLAVVPPDSPAPLSPPKPLQVISVEGARLKPNRPSTDRPTKPTHREYGPSKKRGDVRANDYSGKTQLIIGTMAIGFLCVASCAAYWLVSRR